MNRSRGLPAPPPPDDDDMPPPDDEDDFPPPSDDELPPPDDDGPPPDDDEPPPDDDYEDFAPPPPDESFAGSETPPPPEEADDDLPPDDEDGPPPDDDFPPDDEEGPPDDDLPEDDFDGLLPEDDMDEPPEDDMDDPEDDLDGPPEDDLDEPPEDDLDEPPEDDSEPSPVATRKPTFVLPVRKTASIVASDSPAAGMTMHSAAALAAADLQALSAGLTVKPPPHILRRSIAPPIGAPPRSAPPPSVTSTLPSVTSEAEPPSSPLPQSPTPPPPPPAPSGLSATEVAQKAKAEGYQSCQGKFDVDPFEHLYVKVDRPSKALTVMVDSGEELGFDLSSKAFIFEDTAEANTIVLDYHGNIIVFKFGSEELLINFMKNMPEEVFMAPTEDDPDLLSQQEKKAKEEAEKKARKAPPKLAVASRKISHAPKYERVKGTSVEDILENEVENYQPGMAGAGADGNDAPPPPPPAYPPPPLRKKELIESHIRKPKYSVRRVTLLCEWINSLHIWPNVVSISSLHKEMCNGLLLARVVKYLNPEVQFVHLNEKPLAKKAAIDNLDQALGHIWRSKSLNNSRIPSANDIYSGKTSRTGVLVNELFSVYIVRPLYKNALKILKWYRSILKQYNRPFPAYVFEEGDLSALWPHFQSGTALFCVLFHFFGPSQIGSGLKAQRVDPLQVHADPKSICDYRDNLLYVFALIEALGIDILWTVEDWLSYPDTEFILLQLSLIYEKLKDKQCSLPPAQGNIAGISSGLNGELIVVGLVFKDAPINSRFLSQPHRAVLLGQDHNSMPLLPIDKVIRNPRYFSHGILPGGMITSTGSARLGQIEVDLKESKIHTQREGWNGRTTVRTERDRYEGMHLVNLLRHHHHEKKNGLTEPQTQLAASSRRASALASQSHSPTLFPRSSSPTQLASSQAQTGRVQKGGIQEVDRDIDELVRALDEEMNKAHGHLNASEEILAGRYLELENQASFLSVEDYEALFANLEIERMDLEQERARLQDHFTRKLALIRARRDDAMKKQYNAQQMAFKEVAQSLSRSQLGSQTATVSGRTAVSQSVSANAGQGRTKKTTKPAVVNPKSIEAAEKGWIKLSNAKMNTHNFHLRSKQLASTEQFIAKITPAKLLDQRAQPQRNATVKGGATKAPSGAVSISGNQLSTSQGSEMSRKDLDGEGLGGPSDPLTATYQRSRWAVTTEQTIFDSFQRFQIRLRSASEKWAAARNRSRPRLADLMNSPMKTITAEHIALPEKALAPPIMTKEEMAYAQSLRQAELPLMFYEDERRKMVLAEQSLQYQLRQDLFSSHQGEDYQYPASPSMPATPRHETMQMFSPGMTPQQYPHQAQPQAMSQPSAVEIDAAFRWLSASRPLVLCERPPKEYVFALSEQPIGSVGNERRGFLQYAWEWREFSSHSAQEVSVGCVMLDDIQNLVPHESEPSIFTVVLAESTRALKLTKGRIQLTLRCNSPSDCLKYINALTILLAVR